MVPTNTFCCGVIAFVTFQKPNRFFFCEKFASRWWQLKYFLFSSLGFHDPTWLVTCPYVSKWIGSTAQPVIHDSHHLYREQRNDGWRLAGHRVIWTSSQHHGVEPKARSYCFSHSSHWNGEILYVSSTLEELTSNGMSQEEVDGSWWINGLVHKWVRYPKIPSFI